MRRAPPLPSARAYKDLPLKAEIIYSAVKSCGNAVRCRRFHGGSLTCPEKAPLPARIGPVPGVFRDRSRSRSIRNSRHLQQSKILNALKRESFSIFSQNKSLSNSKIIYFPSVFPPFNKRFIFSCAEFPHRHVPLALRRGPSRRAVQPVQETDFIVLFKQKNISLKWKMSEKGSERLRKRLKGYRTCLVPRNKKSSVKYPSMSPPPIARPLHPRNFSPPPERLSRQGRRISRAPEALHPVIRPRGPDLTEISQLKQTSHAA